MNGKRTFRLLVLGLTLVGWCSVADAAPPWGELLTRHRVDADPEKSYRLGEENGPWMILACSFSGEGAEEQARELVYELRKRYKLEAYAHRMHFDFGDVSAPGVGQLGGARLARYRSGSEKDEIAVLVGNYQAIDDPQAQKTLQKLKNSRPRCLEPQSAERNSQSLAEWRRFFREKVLAPGSKHKERGPLGHAFVSTNPLIPKEYFNGSGVDPFVVALNKDVPHSLLGCAGKYTVQVATFKGTVIIEQDEIEEIKRGKKVASKLAEAAEKAHVLTEALRIKGYEAYEFHDRYASIVTVGSFDSVGRRRVDGRIDIDPGVHFLITTFGAVPINEPVPPGALPNRVKTLMGIPFDVQPIPVEVPKRSIGREMAQSFGR